MDQTKRSQGFQVTFEPAMKARKNPLNHDNAHNAKENTHFNPPPPRKVEMRSHDRFKKGVPKFGKSQTSTSKKMNSTM